MNKAPCGNGWLEHLIMKILLEKKREKNKINDLIEIKNKQLLIIFKLFKE